jgi:hypothetical protein
MTLVGGANEITEKELRQFLKKINLYHFQKLKLEFVLKRAAHIRVAQDVF